MFYTLTEEQARLIATDFQFLIGQPIENGSSLKIEEVVADELDNGDWQVSLKTYLGDKDNFYEIAGHSTLIHNLFMYLTNNNLTDKFVPEKYF